MADLTQQVAESTFEIWATPEVDIKVEYPPEILDELRAAAADGLQRLSRGGIEVGGVLFGTHRDSTVRVLTWRPIECEHASGPAFVLSNKDLATLARLLDSSHGDSDLEGLKPIGWFLSHTRSEISLTPSNVDLFNLFFPWVWQIALVLRPGRMNEARAGIFIRQADGTLRTESSYREFTIEPLRREAIRAEKAPATRPLISPPLIQKNPEETPRELPLPVRPVVRQKPVKRPVKNWLWAIPAVLALLVTFLVLRDRTSSQTDPSLAFRVLDEGNTLRLAWNRSSPFVRSAHQGILQIRDGTAASRIVLSPEQLREGNLSYARQTGDVELTLIAYPSAGEPVRESARFIAQPAADPNIRAEDPSERNRLENQMKQLQSDLARETERADTAEHLVRILENRIQVDSNRRRDAPPR